MNQPDTFLKRFDQQCRLTPDALAVCHDTEQYTYTELSELADRCVSVLLANGVSPRKGVGLLCKRSVSVVACMIACFRTGSAFVPLDPAYPDARLAYMLEDAALDCVVIDAELRKRLASLDLASKMVFIDPADFQRAQACKDADVYAPAIDDRAYIMYTSGSTGKPKGVPISHGALACYCFADIEIYQLTSADRTLQFATLSFDICIEEIFPSLMIGATVVLRPSVRSDSQIELSDIVEQYSITALHLATGYWHEWVDLMSALHAAVPASLSLMVVTGDKVSAEHYQRWISLTSKPVRWVNAYGPTEATVSATAFIPPPGWNEKSMPIGKPLPGYTAYILDANGNPVSADATGELYIGGDALAEGYLNRPSLTDKAFISDPYSTRENARLYRTGDLARWRTDGNIECAGRIDHQLKIGSYRVEPGEVEQIINSFPGVAESLVAGEEIGGRLALTAYVACNRANFDQAALATCLKQQLPEYMVPTRLSVLDVLPKTINGKVDRDALSAVPKGALVPTKAVVEPATDLERQLCSIWRDVLDLEVVGIHDSFISLGGNSLMAVRVIARVHRELDLVLSTRDFFFLDSISLLAAHLEGRAVVRQVPPPEPAFINTRSRQLYSLMQRPDAAMDNDRGLLLIPPVGNEQRRVQRPLRNFMQNLARQGYTLLRFDWQGTGNSSGASVSLMSTQAWCDDLADAASYLAEHVQSFDLLAIRAGTLIAAQMALEDLPLRYRFYLEPVFSGAQWFDEMQQLQSGILNDTYRFLKPRHSRSDGIAEFAGLTLSPLMSESLRSENLLDSLQSHEWNTAAHVIHPGIEGDARLANMTCHRHDIDKANDWVSPRATRGDMQINEAAELIADLMATSQVGSW